MLVRFYRIVFFFFCLLLVGPIAGQRVVQDFNQSWDFQLADSIPTGKWRTLNLPHDWSIELPFTEKAAATTLGGALPGGIGWYQKSFLLPLTSKGKRYFIEFDGIYRNAEVWINGHALGKRPNGYISFQYDLTDYLIYGDKPNKVLVKADNSAQPNSRWYTGSGIYRNVRLVSTSNIAVGYEGSFVTTPKVDKQMATVQLALTINSKESSAEKLTVFSVLFDQANIPVAQQSTEANIQNGTNLLQQSFQVKQPALWSTNHPNLYHIQTSIYKGNLLMDDYTTVIGIRDFHFDAAKGFFLNGQSLKIKGVCLHHDLGALGSAMNVAALKRQLRILQEMGTNAIRTAHNPPARELLDLCDQMGFLVMDEEEKQI
jgi:beta-galactosidase